LDLTNLNLSKIVDATVLEVITALKTALYQTRTLQQDFCFAAHETKLSWWKWLVTWKVEALGQEMELENKNVKSKA
jgi:hypothetical protein